MSWILSEPSVLRIPTSLARFSLRAVERFMKLMQASNKMKTPMSPMSRMKPMRPLPETSESS